jgi:DNA-binding transcriptional LysR family regulator
MELLQLKYFVSAARDESFSRTAERFGVPASNI